MHRYQVKNEGRHFRYLWPHNPYIKTTGHDAEIWEFLKLEGQEKLDLIEVVALRGFYVTVGRTSTRLKFHVAKKTSETTLAVLVG